MIVAKLVCFSVYLWAVRMGGQTKRMGPHDRPGATLTLRRPTIVMYGLTQTLILQSPVAPVLTIQTPDVCVGWVQAAATPMRPTQIQATACVDQRFAAWMTACTVLLALHVFHCQVVNSVMKLQAFIPYLHHHPGVLCPK